MFRIVILLILSSVILHCTRQHPSSSHVKTHPAPQVMLETTGDLLSEINRFRNYIRSDAFKVEQCAPFLRDVYQSLFHKESTRWNLTKVQNDGLDIAKALFLSRLELRQKMVYFDRNNDLSLHCVDAIRSIFRASHFIEETVTQWQHDFPQVKDHVSEAFTKPFPHTAINPHIQTFKIKNDLRSGDVLLSRGGSFVSAAIGRIGDIDTPFSHLSMVYKDANDGLFYVIEAQIEYGTFIRPLIKHLNDGNLRGIVFRQSDSKLGQRAAEWMFNYLKNRKHDLRYDFGLRPNDNTRLFCSEVVRLAYQEASNGTFMVPRFMTQFSMNNRYFLNRLGVKGNETFSPGDIEVDPRFEIIAEWRDYSRAQDIRLKDAVLVKMLAWMENNNYFLNGNFAASTKSNLAWAFRQSRLTSGIQNVRSQFPRHMKRSTLNFLILFENVAKKLYAGLEKRNAEHALIRGIPMVPIELYNALEVWRQHDLETYKNRIYAQRAKKSGIWPKNREMPPLSDFHSDFREKSMWKKQ